MGNGTVISMEHTTFPLHVRVGWLDFSPALQAYARRSLMSAVRPFAAHVRRISVRIAGADSHRDDRACAIHVALHPIGFVAVSAIGRGAYQSVEVAAERLRHVLSSRFPDQSRGQVVRRIA
jgi:hypothetical protein